MAAVFVPLLASSAGAQDRSNRLSTNDQIVLNGQLIVPEGQSVNSAVIFNGPATIQGTVAEAVVVFNGRVDISGTVGKDVVVFNGDVVVRSGARIGGDLVTQTTPQVEPGAVIGGRQRRVDTKFNLKRLGIASKIAIWVAYSLSTLILGILILALIPGLDEPIAEAFRRRTGASIGYGAALFFLVPIAAVFCLIVIVAIPLGLFMLLALPLLYTVGYVLGVHGAGRLVIKPPRSRFLAFFVGWLGLRLLSLIPVLGGLLWLAAVILGLGSLVAAARPRRSDYESPGVSPTPAAPVLPPPPPTE
jgi:hypothetical protein